MPNQKGGYEWTAASYLTKTKTTRTAWCNNVSSIKDPILIFDQE